LKTKSQFARRFQSSSHWALREHLERGWKEHVVILGLGPPISSRGGDSLGDRVLIEFLDVILGGADRCEAELNDMSAVPREDEGKDLAAGEVDEHCSDGNEGNAELDGVEMIDERDAGRVGAAVVKVGTMDYVWCGRCPDDLKLVSPPHARPRTFTFPPLIGPLLTTLQYAAYLAPHVYFTVPMPHDPS
jgi:hypothetical protein